MNKRILYLIQQAGMLMQMPRTHNAHLGKGTFDTVASHSFQVALIAYVLARMEKLTHEQGLEAMAMGILHDLAEARTGDMNYVNKHYTKDDEDRAIKDQFAKLPFGADLSQVLSKYIERDSLIAKCAKDADIVGQAYIEWVLAWQGNKLAEKWFTEKFSLTVPHLRTESAKKILHAMKASDPHQWWWEDFVEQNLDANYLNGRK